MLTSFIAQTGDVSGDWRRGAEEARLNFCCFESRLVAKPCTTPRNPIPGSTGWPDPLLVHHQSGL